MRRFIFGAYALGVAVRDLTKAVRWDFAIAAAARSVDQDALRAARVSYLAGPSTEAATLSEEFAISWQDAETAILREGSYEAARARLIAEVASPTA